MSPFNLQPPRCSLRGLCRPLVFAAVSLFVVEASHADEGQVRSKLENLEQTISAEKNSAGSLKRRSEKTRQEVSRFRQALIEAGNRTRAYEDKVTKLEGRLRNLDTEVNHKSAVLTVRADELGLSLGALARLSRRPNLSLIAGPYAAVDSARSAILLGKLVPTLEQQAHALRAGLVELASLRRDLGSERERLDVARKSLDQERQSLRNLLAQKEKSYRRLQAQQAAKNKRLQGLARKAKSLQSLLASLQAEAERVAELERQAKDAASRIALNKPAPPTLERAEKQTTKTQPPRIAALPPQLPGHQPRKLPDTFRDARGSLPLPARGKLVELFGTRTRLGTPSRGMTIATRSNAAVIAPHDGKVVFAGQFRGYGELLIIAHGGGYHTLLAGMARNYGVVGQWLLAGEPVGLMSDGRDGEPRLYVELRRNGAPINPLPWLAASERKVSG